MVSIFLLLENILGLFLVVKGGVIFRASLDKISS